MRQVRSGSGWVLLQLIPWCSYIDLTRHIQHYTKQLSLKQLPPILSFNLKHYDGSASRKLNTVVRLPAELDMTPFTTRSVKHRNKMGEKKRRDSGGGHGIRRVPSRAADSLGCVDMDFTLLIAT